MSITITLGDDLAAKLARQAAGHNVTTEEFAVGILARAVSEPADGGEVWSKLNTRRLTLIAKEVESRLTDQEDAELAALQEAAAKACGPQDMQLLATVRKYEESASGFDHPQNE